VASVPPEQANRATVRAEFERAARGFAERTRGRFDQLDVARFSRAQPGATVVEVGAGAGNFLALFAPVAAHLIAVDITPGMLREAQARHPRLRPLLADGAALPFPDGAIDLVASAQVLHHVPEPAPLLREMRRVKAARGRVLILDQVATERPAEAAAMNALEVLRDPSHAASRPPGELGRLLEAAGLALVDERQGEVEERLSQWMWPGEFPEARIAAVRAFIARRGHETGMAFRPAGDDYAFTRRRILLLAE
jgi:SAM-dependent methyltransferase